MLAGQFLCRVLFSTDDYLLPPPRVSSESANYWLGPIPSTVVLKTDVKYDNSLLEHFDNSHEKTQDWVEKVVKSSYPGSFMAGFDFEGAKSGVPPNSYHYFVIKCY